MGNRRARHDLSRRSVRGGSVDWRTGNRLEWEPNRRWSEPRWVARGRWHRLVAILVENRDQTVVDSCSFSWGVFL